LKLTETLKSANSYNWGDTSVTTTKKHKYILAVVNYTNSDGNFLQTMTASFSAGKEVLRDKTLGEANNTSMSVISLYMDAPAGTTISYTKSQGYATTMYLQVYCFD